VPQPHGSAAPAGRFDYDRSVPFSSETRTLVESSGTSLEDLSYASPKAGRVSAYLARPCGPGPHPGIVFGHWGPGTRTEFLAEALRYAQAGVACLLPDYPWTRPAPWRRNLAGFGDPEKDLETQVQAVVDLRRGLDLLESLPDVDRSRLCYVGHSYGAQWGAILAAVDRRAEAYVLVGGLGATRDAYLDNNEPDMVALRRQAPSGQLEKYVEAVGVLDAIRYVPSAAPAPLLFQFARYERYFDAASMNRYWAAASEPKEVCWYDCGHELNDPQALADRSRFLAEHVGLPRLTLPID
jgi:dienelactone hydrolase